MTQMNHYSVGEGRILLVNGWPAVKITRHRQPAFPRAAPGAIDDFAKRAALALNACEELIRGEGDAHSQQRAIDLARLALGLTNP